MGTNAQNQPQGEAGHVPWEVRPPPIGEEDREASAGETTGLHSRQEAFPQVQMGREKPGRGSCGGEALWHPPEDCVCF